MASFWDTLPAKLAETWPARMAQDLWSAAQAPGNAYASTPDNPVTTEQMIKPAADLAGLITGGSFSAPAVKGGAGMGIRAYHGSPHDFDRFDLSRIGTGEGAQAYGHGLYFAEAEPVAREYQKVLTRRGVNDGEIAPSVTGNALYDIAEKNGGLIGGKMPFGPNRTLMTREQIVGGFEQGKFSPFDLPPAMQRQIVDHIKPPGRMYEVNINAHPDQFLDWDAPFSQPNRLRDITGELPALPDRSPTGMPLKPRRVADAYGDLARSMGSQEALTKELRDAGIPGIKYLDQGSRGAVVPASMQHAYKPWGGDLDVPKPSRNYVVFDDSLIDILRKYGIAGLGVTGAGSQMLGANQSAPVAGM